MKKVLFVSNIEVPYRTEFFNQLSKKVDLTVLYERKKSSNRNQKWTSSIESCYKIKYLKGINYKNEYSISFGIIRYILSNEYDSIIIGCYSSPSQILAIMIMRLFRIKYILNLDGEYFFDGKGFIKRVKQFLIKGAYKYCVAGDITKIKLSKYVDSKIIYPYYFSSLTQKEITYNSKHLNNNNNNKILVVGQYFDYKGLDIALECAKLDDNFQYCFVGSGNRSHLLQKKVEDMNLKNVQIIPFLQKKDLYLEYQHARFLLLPSKKECWGLVINEASSFGCPIVSTKGSGAAVEFLDSKYQCFLAENSNVLDLFDKIKKISNYSKINEYKDYLINRSKKYTIENMVDALCITIKD